MISMNFRFEISPAGYICYKIVEILFLYFPS